MDEYLKIVKQIKNINSEYALNHYEITILNLVAEAYSNNYMVSVQDLIRHKEIASQATLHYAFKCLLNKQLLFTKTHNKDGRMKEVFLTRSALNYYNKLERNLHRALL
jgi:DNA-binding MarR family transcriptional regulator